MIQRRRPRVCRQSNPTIRDTRHGRRVATSTGAEEMCVPGLSHWEREFIGFYDSRRAVLVRFAMRFLQGERSVSEDCVQSAASSIWQHRARHAASPDALPRLFFRVVRHRALDEAKRASRAARREAPIETCDQPGWLSLGDAERDLAVREDVTQTVFTTLTASERVVFWQVVIRECSPAEAAALLDISTKSVRNHLASVRRKLAVGLGWVRRPPPPAAKRQLRAAWVVNLQDDQPAPKRVGAADSTIRR